MGRIKLIKYSIVGSLAILIGTYNACSPFQEVGLSSSSERLAISESAFQKTLYPELQKNCAQCHSTIQQPFFSSTNTDEAHSIVLQRGLVDFANPSNSHFLVKLGSGHNNFSPATIDMMGSKIQAWVQAVNDYDATRPIPNAPGVGGDFEPASASSVLTKLKYLVHGGALTELELTANVNSVTNKTKMKTLIDSWMNTPEGNAKLQFYLTNALNQDIMLGEDSQDVFGISNNSMFENSLKESFSHTVMDLINKNQPFTNINTTNRIAVNTALLSAYAFMEKTSGRGNDLRDLLRGREARAIPSDYSDWRFITFQESKTQVANLFSDLAYWRALPNESKVSFAIPRVGFFSTLAFQGKYPSNTDNQFRNITNQTLIAGLGRTFSPSDTTDQPNLIHVDNDHARQTNECFACHRLMDPMRMVFQNKMNFQYRYNSKYTDVASSFSFYNYITPMKNLTDLGKALTAHPDFANAWVQKMCVAFNSSKCLENDPEFLKVATAFKSSNYNFKTLYKDIILSDLVTGLKATKTSKAFDFAVNRVRETHLCYNLNARQRQIQAKRSIAVDEFDGGSSICRGSVSSTSDALGDDHTVRGLTEVVNSFPVDTFSRQAIERTCVNLGNYFLGNDTRLLSRAENDLNTNIDLMTELLIGLPVSHPRHYKIKNSIRSVYDYSKKDLAMNHTSALKEAFNFACTSPDFTGAGL